MSTEHIKTLKNILIFLYGEETVYKDYLKIDRIQDETELSAIQIQEGLRTLRHSGYVDYVYRDKRIGIEEARITNIGKKKAEQLLKNSMIIQRAPRLWLRTRRPHCHYIYTI
jgi:hypothetical protein